MSSTAIRWIGVGITLALLWTMLMGVARPMPASAADPLPVTPGAVPLPAVQIDGVAWQQVTIGDTVYVGGSFSTARPAGAALGVDTVTRRNLLAFDINTGELRPGFVANTNAQVLGLARSPDGTKLYVSGDFTEVNGKPRYRIAALNPTTGSVIESFRASTDYRVRSMVATKRFLYVGGSFSDAGGARRRNLAAFRTSDGAVLNWAPAARNGQVMALALTPDRSKIVVAGSFDKLNGVSAAGLGAVDRASGATVAFPANKVIGNSGSSSAIYSLTTDDARVYGSGYVYRSGGNLEGNFATDSAGRLLWLNDIHGDQYDVHSARGMLFTVGHAHADGNVTGGFPQLHPSRSLYAVTQTNYRTGTVLPNTTVTGNYASFTGLPGSTALHWYPDFAPGTYTSSGQATWTVGGNDDYVVVAGEFTRVNTLRQQGIVRFAFRDVQPVNEAPQLGGSGFVPRVTSPAAGTAQISFESNWDRDDERLTYEVQREGAGTIRTYADAWSSFFRRPVLTHLDTGLPPGSRQRYRVIATDSAGTKAFGDWVEVRIDGTGTLSAYAEAVLTDHPRQYYRMSDRGDRLADSAFSWSGSTHGAPTREVPGAIAGDADTATRFSAIPDTATPTASFTTPTDLTTEAWIRTTSRTGGLIIGFGEKPAGESRQPRSDYRTYMTDDGRISFGVHEGSPSVVTSPASYNDGQWHHVVSTLSWDGGQNLYVDGQRVASRAQVKHGRAFTGYWRIGGDSLVAWPARPTTDYLNADIDEVAIYEHALTGARVRAHHAAAGDAPSEPIEPPVAALSVQAAGLTVTANGSESSDPDGSLVSYGWDFGDGSGTVWSNEPRAEHTYARSGVYDVALTVRDDQGWTSRIARTVTLGKVARVSVAKAGYGNKLYVDIDPNKRSRNWRFTVQKRVAGAWQSLSSYSTEGLQDTRTVRLGPGTFRVVVPPQFRHAGVTSAEVRLTRKTVKVTASPKKRRSRLFVDVDPDKGSGSWDFQVQKRRSNGTWRTRAKVWQTQGAAETRLLDLSAGTYRVVVARKYGFRGSTSNAVTLKR